MIRHNIAPVLNNTRNRRTKVRPSSRTEPPRLANRTGGDRAGPPDRTAGPDRRTRFSGAADFPGRTAGPDRRAGPKNPVTSKRKQNPEIVVDRSITTRIKK